MGEQASTRMLTLRLGGDKATQLDAIARVEGCTVASLLRETVAKLIDERRRDPVFQERLAAAVQRDRQLLERLSQS